MGCVQFSHIITIELTFAGINMFFGATQNHFSPSVARVKMSSEKGQKHVYAQEHYYYYNNFKGLLTFNV